MMVDNISFLKNAADIEEITEGYSGAYKYRFNKDNKLYFLKIGKFAIDRELENTLNEANILHPKIIEFGKYDAENNYIIEEYIEGNNLKEELDHYDCKFIYEFGFKIGEQYRNLRKLHPDIPMTDEKYESYIIEVNKKIDRCKNLLKNNHGICLEHTDFINYIINYLEANKVIVKNSTLVYGHTDIKPSNFLIYNKNIYASDIEHTDYKELSFSMIHSYARNDFKDDKNFSFASGFLEGLFNLNVPENILACFNYTYIFRILHYCTNYIEKNKLVDLNRLIVHIKNNYITNNEINICGKLKSIANIKHFPELKDFSILLVKGSYNPENLTFKCISDTKNYFLKIMKISNSRFKKILNFYKILEDCNIPISPLRYYGECKKDKYYYTISDYIEYPEMGKYNNNTYIAGYEYSQLVAKYLVKLKNRKKENIGIYTKENLKEDIMKHVEIIYKDTQFSKYLKWTKKEIIDFIDFHIKAFDEDSINLIHGDVKFGNILYNGENNIFFVDNENLIYSYDIINFLYNIQAGFLEPENLRYKGFVIGYLKYMNGGKIPLRIHDQAKLLLLYYLLRTVVGVLNNTSRESKIQNIQNICEIYMGKDNKVAWLS